MPPDLICPHCLRSIRTTGDDSQVARRCTTCGKSFSRAAAAAAPRAMSIRPGMKGRDDDDDYEDDVEYEDERPSRRGRKRRDERPGKVQAIAIMTLIGGIYAILHFLGISTFSYGMCCLWPGTYYALVVGILAIIKGSQLLGQDAAQQAPPKTIAILMIIEIVNGDVICTVLGIICLIFCGDPEVEDYLQGPR